MTIERTTTFEKISQRVIYGLNFMYSDFAPIESEKADAQTQRKLHQIMGQLIESLYKNPDLLNLAGNADEAYAWYEINKTKPELDKVYKSIFKGLFDFYKFVYMTFLLGRIGDNRLSISKAVLKENKTSFKPEYKNLLKEIGLDIEGDRTEIVVVAENEIIQSLKLLAECIPVHVNPWTPYALINFACCSFTGNFEDLLARVDHVAGFNGLLLDLQTTCIENGYDQNIRLSFGASGFDFNITFRHNVGGFVIGYNPRKYWQFYFGSMNSIGVKAMLEDFDRLDLDLQKYLVSVCKTCNGCLSCTKGGRNKIFAVKVNSDGKEYILCPDNYSRHIWETLNQDVVAILFKYHAAQEIYGT